LKSTQVFSLRIPLHSRCCYRLLLEWVAIAAFV
jgi:hypothetical protein